jgi:hypothetical protein
MYRIKVGNLETGIAWYEYGFKGFMMKRIHFLFNDRNEYTYYSNYEILQIEKIVFTWKTFKKCLTNKAELC